MHCTLFDKCNELKEDKDGRNKHNFPFFISKSTGNYFDGLFELTQTISIEKNENEEYFLFY